MFTALLEVWPDKYVGGWWFEREIIIPFIPVEGTEILFPLNTVEDAEIEVTVTGSVYRVADHSTKIRCDATCTALCLLYLHSENWRISGDGAEAFKKDESETLREVREALSKFKHRELRS